jgi:hypothetical protein
LSSQNEKTGGRGRKSRQSEAARKDPSRGKQKKRPNSPEVGQALRSVYQRTIEEDIPPEMLDLLGKLG